MPRKCWVVVALAGLVFWLVLCPALTVPGLVQGLPDAVTGALGAAVILALVHDPVEGEEKGKGDSNA